MVAEPEEAWGIRRKLKEIHNDEAGTLASECTVR